MSDPLSVAAGVAGLVSLGIQLAQGLYTLADGIGSAGTQVRSLALEVSTFSKLFGKVRQELLDGDPRHAQTDIVRDILDVCEQVLEPLQKMQKRLDVLLVKFRDSPSKLRNFGLRVQWIFSAKNKMLWLRGVLNVQHQVLDTILELIILQTTKDRSQGNITYLSVVLDMSVQGIRGMLQNHRHTIEQSGVLMLTHAEADSTSGAAVSEDSPDDGVGGSEPAQSALIARPQQDPEVDRLAGEAEEDFDVTLQQNGEAIWDDTRAVSRKVVRRAQAALDNPEEHEGLRPRAETVTADDNASASLRGATSSSLKSNIEDLPDATTLISSVVGTRPGKPISEIDTLIFNDVEGRKYEIPEKDIKKFEDMERFLLSLYPPGPMYPQPDHYGREVRDDRAVANELLWDRHDAIRKGEYYLYIEDGIVLLPEFWSSLISRKRNIQLRFHVASINGKALSSVLHKPGGITTIRTAADQPSGRLRKLFGGRSHQ